MIEKTLSAGDKCPHECPKCESNNTIFTEYAYDGDKTELGFECEDCNYEVDPDELNNYYEDQQ